jgi:hypothetical protein
MINRLTASNSRLPSDPFKTVALKRPIVVFDGGNRTLKWIDIDNRPRLIPAFIKHFEPGFDDPTPDDHSVVISAGDDHFCLGAVARDMKGIPVFQDNKCELAKKVVLAAIEPHPGSSAVTIQRLVIALPNSRNQTDMAELEKIEGTHQFTRNGQRITAVVHQVQPIDETQSAYSFAMKRDLYRSKRQINGVLEGATSIRYIRPLAN